MLNPSCITRKKINQLFAIILFAYLFFSCKAYAIGLADLKVYSDLNQPLSAEIEVVGLKNMDTRGLRVSLASDKDFALAGIVRSFSLNKLKFEIISVKDKSVVYIWTNEVVQDPFIEFLLELEWPGGKIVKGFTILIDPPELVDKATRGIPLAFTEEYQKSIQNTSFDSELKASFPYDVKLAEKLKTAEISKDLSHSANISQTNVSTLNSNLIKSGDSLKDLAEGFAVGEHEIIIPPLLIAPLQAIKVTKINPESENQYIVVGQDILKQPVKVPEKLVIVPVPPLASTIVEPAKPAMLVAQQSTPKAPKAAAQKDIKSIFNPLANKPSISTSTINERQAAISVIQKYKPELIISFLLLVIALLFVAKMLREWQMHNSIDEDIDYFEEIPLEEVASAAKPEVITEPIATEASVTVVEPKAAEPPIEEIEIPEIPQMPTETAEKSMRLNLASQYIEAGDIASAKEILQDLVRTSTAEIKAKAESLLGSISS